MLKWISNSKFIAIVFFSIMNVSKHHANELLYTYLPIGKMDIKSM